MKKINANEYFDKVYGGWLGKCLVELQESRGRYLGPYRKFLLGHHATRSP